MSKKYFKKSKAIIKDRQYTFAQAWNEFHNSDASFSNKERILLYSKFLWYRVLHFGHMKRDVIHPVRETELDEKKYPGSKRLFEQWKEPYGSFNPGEATSILKQQSANCNPTQTTDTIDVIIPVYNGRNHLELLLPTLFANTKQPHRFIFVDDCSPDKSTIDFLKSQIDGREDCVLMSNENNLGFTGTVNHGATIVKSPFFVLLNTDVVVPEGWLERLIAPMYIDEKIGTTTPFTNGGVFFSFPNFCDNHRIKNPLDFHKIDNIFKQFGTRTSPDLEFINGVGFCIAIRKKCWDKYGNLDEKAFGRGYGEECDMCFRYLSKGYKNFIVPNLYVYHNHGGSFDPEEKKALNEEHSKILSSRWKGYIKLIDNFVQNDPWAKYRLSVLEQEYIGNTDSFIIDLNSEDGGACKFRLQIEQDLISQGKKVVTLLYSSDAKTKWTLTFPNNDGRASFILKEWAQAEKWIEALAPKEIKINNLAFCFEFNNVIQFLAGATSTETFPNPAMGYCGTHDVKLWYCFHDFYSCCPSIFLLTDNDEFCNYKCCDECKKGNHNMTYDLDDINAWRENWKHFLTFCTQLRFFSENTYNLVKMIHNIPDEKVQIEGHKALVKITKKFTPQSKNAPLHIAVIGAWHKSKGSLKVIELAKHLKKTDKDARIYFYGVKQNEDSWSTLKLQCPNIIWRGRYNILDLPDILYNDGITLVFFPSVYPETYSFVTRECMDINVPIVAFPIGASGDRVKEYDKGIVTKDFSVESVYNAIKEAKERFSK